jgi:hypothetical protein
VEKGWWMKGWHHDGTMPGWRMRESGPTSPRNRSQGRLPSLKRESLAASVCIAEACFHRDPSRCRIPSSLASHSTIQCIEYRDA